MTDQTRPCEVCGEPIDPERIEVLPETRLCTEHGKQITKYGGEFLLTATQSSLGKDGSLKKNYGDVSIRQTNMDWRYYFPHAWPGDRHAWEDVYLRPADSARDGTSFCVTVDAVGPGGNDCYSDEENAVAREKLRDSPYHVDGQSMIVRGVDFSKEELLGWVRVWLGTAGFSVGQLVEGTHEQFMGTNWHRCAVEEAARRASERERG